MAKKPAKKAVKKRVKKPVKAAAKPAPEPKGITVMQLLMGIISYLWILCIIPLLVMRKDAFVHFHARQGLVLFLSSIAVFVLSVLSAIAPIIGILSFLLLLVLFVFGVAGIVIVILGRQWKMPLLGEWAAKLDL